MDSDAALAAALQEEYDAEHDRRVSAEERRVNLFTQRCGEDVMGVGNGFV